MSLPRAARVCPRRREPPKFLSPELLDGHATPPTFHTAPRHGTQRQPAGSYPRPCPRRSGRALGGKSTNKKAPRSGKTWRDST
nr:MAG TPA: hypothetical protein [Caudoviricetes sp.]